MSGDYLSPTNAALSARGGSGDPGTSTSNGGGSSNGGSSSGGSSGGSASGQAIVNYAMQYLGYPYVWATHGPSSFDCSGFTYWVVLNTLGIDIGAGTGTQIGVGTPVSQSDLSQAIWSSSRTPTPGVSRTSASTSAMDSSSMPRTKRPESRSAISAPATTPHGGTEPGGSSSTTRRRSIKNARLRLESGIFAPEAPIESSAARPQSVRRNIRRLAWDFNPRRHYGLSTLCPGPSPGLVETGMPLRTRRMPV
jgi:hypothetical protein